MTSLVAEYVNAQIKKYFDERKFNERLRALQPKIEEAKHNAYRDASENLRAAIDEREMYWVVQLRITVKSTVVVAGRGSTMLQDAPDPELLWVKISASPENDERPAKYNEPVVAPAKHSVILLESSQIVTYAEPIVSWHSEELKRRR